MHATLASVVLALAIPLRVREGRGSPLLALEHGIQPWVAFLIVPIFGFTNAGVPFGGMAPSILLEPITLGVAAGLFLGKQVGVFSATWIATSTGMAARPSGAS